MAILDIIAINVFNLKFIQSLGIWWRILLYSSVLFFIWSSLYYILITRKEKKYKEKLLDNPNFLNIGLQAIQDELIKIKDFNKARTIFDRKFKDKYVEDNLEIYKILKRPNDARVIFWNYGTAIFRDKKEVEYLDKMDTKLNKQGLKTIYGRLINFDKFNLFTMDDCEIVDFKYK